MSFSAETDWLPNGLQFSDKGHDLCLWLHTERRKDLHILDFHAALKNCFGKIPVQENNEDLKARLQVAFADKLEDKNPWGYGPPTTLCVESPGPVLPGFAASKEILERIIDTWKIPRKLFDEIQKPGSFPQFLFFEVGQNLHIGFRWSSAPGSYLIFLGSMSSITPFCYHHDGVSLNPCPPTDQFRVVFSNRDVLTPTWNGDVMKSGEDVFGRWEGSPVRLPVMMLNQCEKHLESSIQQQAEKVEEMQRHLSLLEAKLPGSGVMALPELYARYRELTTSIFTLRNSCRNLMEICSGFVTAFKTSLSSKHVSDNRLGNLKAVRDGIERIHSRLKFQLNRIHYLENIHIQSTKSMAALKHLMLLNKSR